ncbi:hypothetical protein SF83666_b54270 (plasmid) [Sinorhizobium fredii CCBAU 83666]|nr:hypothetical protein SF83666_b54270 [Sinorhizobium fredii CCBAU 83666]
MFRNSELSTEGSGHSASSSLPRTYPNATKRRLIAVFSCSL